MSASFGENISQTLSSLMDTQDATSIGPKTNIRSDLLTYVQHDDDDDDEYIGPMKNLSICVAL